MGCQLEGKTPSHVTLNSLSCSILSRLNWRITCSILRTVTHTDVILSCTPSFEFFWLPALPEWFSPPLETGAAESLVAVFVFSSILPSLPPSRSPLLVVLDFSIPCLVFPWARSQSPYSLDICNWKLSSPSTQQQQIIIKIPRPILLNPFQLILRPKLELQDIISHIHNLKIRAHLPCRPHHVNQRPLILVPICQKATKRLREHSSSRSDLHLDFKEISSSSSLVSRRLSNPSTTVWSMAMKREKGNPDERERESDSKKRPKRWKEWKANSDERDEESDSKEKSRRWTNGRRTQMRENSSYREEKRILLLLFSHK